MRSPNKWFSIEYRSDPYRGRADHIVASMDTLFFTPHTLDDHQATNHVIDMLLDELEATKVGEAPGHRKQLIKELAEGLKLAWDEIYSLKVMHAGTVKIESLVLDQIGDLIERANSK